jgi:hypothetical protein
VEGARLSAGAAHALTAPDGRAHLRVRRSGPGAVRVSATKQRLIAGRGSVIFVRG